jgi:hypothetical protein
MHIARTRPTPELAMAINHGLAEATRSNGLTHRQEVKRLREGLAELRLRDMLEAASPPPPLPSSPPAPLSPPSKTQASSPSHPASPLQSMVKDRLEVENRQRMDAMSQQRLHFIRRPLQSFTAEEINDLDTDELRLVCSVHSIAVLVSELEYLGFIVYNRNSKLRRALKREYGILPPPAENPPSSGGGFLLLLCLWQRQKTL